MTMDTFKRLWKETEDSLIGTKQFFMLSPSHYAAYRDGLPCFKKYVGGITLDLGAGRSPYEFLVKPLASHYFTCDVKTENMNLSFAADGEKLGVKNESVETVLSLAVLEHTKNPGRMLDEIARVLKPGGHAIFLFPHLCYLHAEPEDYFRYTIYGFQSLCPENMKTVFFTESGSLLSFITIPFFILIHAAARKVFILRDIVFLLCAFLTKTICALDAVHALKHTYPLNYFVVLKKD